MNGAESVVFLVSFVCPFSACSRRQRVGEMIPLFWAGLRVSQDVIWLVSCNILGSFQVEEYVVWCALVESPVGPLCVVEPNTVFDHAFGLETIL